MGLNKVPLNAVWRNSKQLLNNDWYFSESCHDTWSNASCSLLLQHMGLKQTLLLSWVRCFISTEDLVNSTHFIVCHWYREKTWGHHNLRIRLYHHRLDILILTLLDVKNLPPKVMGCLFHLHHINPRLHHEDVIASLNKQVKRRGWRN